MIKVLEKHIEQKLIKKVKDKGGLALKLVSPSLDGLPDRLLLLSKGKIAFAELKAPGKKLRPLQEKRKRQLEELGFLVFEIDNANEIDEIIEEIAGGDAS